MKPERWNQVDRLLDAALDLRACGGDEALRKEVDGLLASDNDAHSFIEEPALELVSFRTEPAEALKSAFGDFVFQPIPSNGVPV
jgi:hypothetical protein